MLKSPPRKRRMTTKERDAFYKAACGEADYPICPYCLQPVRPSENWDEGHNGTPRALNGTDTSVWHSRCNRIHGAKVVTPLVAKVKRQYKKHRDIYRSRNPFRSREKPYVRTPGGELLDRVTRRPWGRKDD
jgi:hypothetical protein